MGESDRLLATVKYHFAYKLKVGWVDGSHAI